MEYLPRHASLLGLPAELRLLVYEQLMLDTIHIHSTFELSIDNDPTTHEMKTRPCTCPDPDIPQLCTRPRFSPFYRPTEACGDWYCLNSEALSSLKKTCKQIHKEMHIMSHKNYTRYWDKQGRLCEDFGHLPSSVTIDLNDLDRLSSNTRGLGMITRLTLTNVCHILSHEAKKTFEGLARYAQHLIHLRSIALHGPTPIKRFLVGRKKTFDPEASWRSVPAVKMIEKIFGSRLTIILDAWICLKPGQAPMTAEPVRRFFLAEVEMIWVRGVLQGLNKVAEDADPKRTSCTVKREVFSIWRWDRAEWREFWKTPGLIFGGENAYQRIFENGAL